MKLDKMGKMIWDVVGVALGILFLLGILAIFIGIGFALYQYKTHHVEGVLLEPGRGDTAKGGLKVTVQYEMPLPVEDSEYLIVPVTLEMKKQEQEQNSLRSEVSVERKSRGYSGSLNTEIYSHQSGPYYNLVFIDMKTGESRLLLDNKGFIEGIYFPEKKYGGKDVEKKLTFLLMKIATADTNRDGVINGEDALTGYLSNLDGTKLTQITPSNTQMGWWRYDSEKQMLFTEVIQDLNNDHKFNWDDPKVVLKVDMRAPQIGTEFVPAEVKDKVAEILKGIKKGFVIAGL